ncbi:hypothetical protein QJS66_20730 [Kocuria rhizophila]|nr:hypothetical protein QJS66_20730 [Kocuria rhizophila]
MPEGSRAAENKSLQPSWLASRRSTRFVSSTPSHRSAGQPWPRSAIAWTLRPQDSGPASSWWGPPPLTVDSARAVADLEFSTDELRRIDELVTDAGVNVGAATRERA